MRKVNRRRILYGFTIAELLITMAVLGFVMMLSVPIIGMKKAKNPNYTNVPHGTFECYYEGDTLRAYWADSNENKTGSEGEVVKYDDEGEERTACSFTMSSTSSILLQAVGAGGNAAEDIDHPIVRPVDTFNDPAGVNKDGEIRTDNNFKSDLDSAPLWVKQRINTLWANNPNLLVKYTVTSPVGKGGEYKAGTVIKSNDSDCEPCWNGGSYCPNKCKIVDSANGGNSARQGKVVLSKQITRDEDITYQIDENTTVLRFSANNSFSFASSQNGGSARKLGNIYKDGANGDDFDYNSENKRGYEIYSKTLTTSQGTNALPNTALKIVSKSFNEVRNAGSTSNTGNKNLKATPGSISANPTKIPYSSTAAGIQVSFSPAGEPGKFIQRFYEKLPAGTELLLVPAKTSEENSLLYVRAVGADSFNILAVAESGKNAEVQNYNFRMEQEEDLPFPSGLYPALFANVKSGFIVTASNRYISKVADIISDESLQPGRSGYGVYPIIEYFKGKSTHSIWGRSVDDDTNNGTYVIKLSSPINTCLDGSVPINGDIVKKSSTVNAEATANKYCKSSLKGNPGAVVVSW